jgi:hypothetical protein
LLSTSIYVPVITTVTGFTYRGLAPHKITPMPGVHLALHLTLKEFDLSWFLKQCAIGNNLQVNLLWASEL